MNRNTTSPNVVIEYAACGEDSAAGSIVLDRRGFIREADRATCNILGKTREELVLRKITSFLAKQDYRPFGKYLRNHNNGHLVRNQFRIAPGKEGIDLRLFVLPARMANGAPEHPAILLDNTACSAALRSSARLASLVDSLPVLISYVDKDFRYRFNNAPYRDWFRVRREEIAGKHVRTIVGTKAWKVLKPHMQAALAGEHRCFQMSVPYKTSGPRQVQVDYVPHRVGSGKVSGFYALIRDISDQKRLEHELTRTEAFNRAVLDSLSAHVAVLDRQGNIVGVNEAWRRFARENGDPQLIHTGVGMNYLRACTGGSQARFVRRGLKRVLRVAKRNVTFECEYCCPAPNEDRWFLMLASPLDIERGGAVVSHIDITSRKIAEHKLAQAQRIAGLGSFEQDLVHPKRSECSREMLRLIGRPRARPTPLEFLETIVHPADRERVRLARENVLITRKPYQIEYRIVRPNGVVRWVQCTGHPVLDDRHQVIRISSTLLDITERKRLEQSIARVAEAEQRRIAMDLHDGLGQVLSGTMHLASGLFQRLQGADSALELEAARIQQLLQQAMAQTRQLSRGLYPVRSESGGLAAALEELAAQTREVYRVDCRVKLSRLPMVKNQSAATHIYRIAQEAIQNAIRHGKCRRLWIFLGIHRNLAVLSIRDNGSGMAPGKKKGMGLEIMRSRVSILRGSLSIVSRANYGTRIACSFPKAVLTEINEGGNHEQFV